MGFGRGIEKAWLVGGGGEEGVLGMSDSFPAGPEGSNCVWMCACHGLSLGGETLRLQTPMVGLLGESAVILPL